MAFTKHASLEHAQVLGIKGSDSQIRTASLDKFADFEDFRTEDGFLYARIRAISSRVNKNHDGWPSVELAGGQSIFDKFAGVKTASFVVEADSNAEYGYSTFLGKPIFVDHHNSDPSRARGVIVDSKLHVEDHKTASQLDPYYANAPENHTPPTWVELLLEVDAKSFPKLAKAIIEGSKDPSKGIDGFSMGCDVERSKCSHCANVATTPDDYCEHVRLKGAEFPYTDPKTGKTSSRKSYEDCYGIKFFEISAVFDPADETALLREVRAHTAAEKQSDAFDQFRTDEMGVPNPSGDIACPECHGAGCEACHGTGQANANSVERPGTDGFMTPQTIDNLPFGAANPASPNIESVNPEESGYGPRRQGSTHTAEAPPPQVDELKMPEQVDTLREESICPVCGSDMDEETCAVCGYTRPPEGFDNPDLTKANPKAQEDEGEGEEHDETFDGSMPPKGDNTSNNPSFAHVTNDMSWTASTTYETKTANQYVQQRGGKWVVVQKGTGKTLSTHDSKDDAEASFRAMEMHKHEGQHHSYTNPATETPVVPNAGPQTDEPKGSVIKQDHTKPVTSQVRTAEDFLAAAGAKRRTMPEKTADAASGAPEAATPDKNVDTDAVGGVMEATNEEASKADAQIDVEGVGTTGTSDVAADSTESVDQGDEHSKNIEEIPTKTFDNGTGVEKQRDPVGSDAYPAEGGVTSSWQVTALDSEPYPHEDGGLAGGGAVEGTQPSDPVGTPDERVDVLDSTTSPENNSGPTKTWSGTDGNGIYRQQDPVTNETLEGEDLVNLSPSTSSTHIFAAFKLAEEEVDLGLTPKEQKFERAAELEKLSPEELQAESRVVSRVKTAGLSKATPKTAKRMPSLGRNASVDKESSEASSTNSVNDSQLFL